LAGDATIDSFGFVALGSPTMRSSTLKMSKRKMLGEIIQLRVLAPRYDRLTLLYACMRETKISTAVVAQAG
jgi:hypothetical protein